MEITFTLARAHGVTPFEIMKQDLDYVIMVISHYLERGNGNNDSTNNEQPKTEREESRDFWAAF